MWFLDTVNGNGIRLFFRKNTKRKTAVEISTLTYREIRGEIREL
jgi:hypothetical protein